MLLRTTRGHHEKKNARSGPGFSSAENTTTAACPSTTAILRHAPVSCARMRRKPATGRSPDGLRSGHGRMAFCPAMRAHAAAQGTAQQHDRQTGGRVVGKPDAMLRCGTVLAFLRWMAPDWLHETAPQAAQSRPRGSTPSAIDKERSLRRVEVAPFRCQGPQPILVPEVCAGEEAGRRTYIHNAGAHHPPRNRYRE